MTQNTPNAKFVFEAAQPVGVARPADAENPGGAGTPPDADAGRHPSRRASSGADMGADPQAMPDDLRIRSTIADLVRQDSPSAPDTPDAQPVARAPASAPHDIAPSPQPEAPPPGGAEAEQAPALQALYTRGRAPDPQALFPQLLNTLCVSGHAITMAELRGNAILLALDGHRIAIALDDSPAPEAPPLFRPETPFAELPAARLALALRKCHWRLLITVAPGIPDHTMQAATDALFAHLPPQIVVWLPGQLALCAREYARCALSDLNAMQRGAPLPHLRHRYERPVLAAESQRCSVFSGAKPAQQSAQDRRPTQRRTRPEDARFPPVPVGSPVMRGASRRPEEEARIGPVSRCPEEAPPPARASGPPDELSPPKRLKRLALTDALCDAITIDTGTSQPQTVTTLLLTVSLGLQISSLMISAMGAAAVTF